MSAALGRLPVSVIIPTIGRPAMLVRCLNSLLAARPLADEIIIVDQSRSDAVANLVAEFRVQGVVLEGSEGRGIALARNEGLRRARHDTIFFTDDDCTVSSDWVRVGSEFVARDPGSLFTGRVLPGGDSAAIPSSIERVDPRDYVGDPIFGVLYTANLACSRQRLLDAGGFDSRIRPTASDNELGYRWLSQGRPIRYRPELIVHHHQWRTQAQVRERYVEYAEGQGVVYCKYLRAGEMRMLRYILSDLRTGLRIQVRNQIHRADPVDDWRTGILRGLPVGLLRGWRAFRP